MREVAARGGLVGIWPLAGREGGMEAFFRSLDHARRGAGIEHVRIGTDMGGLVPPPAGLAASSIPSYQAFAAVPAALLAQGFSEANLRQLLGGNLLRVFEEVLVGARA